MTTTSVDTVLAEQNMKIRMKKMTGKVWVGSESMEQRAAMGPRRPTKQKKELEPEGWEVSSVEPEVGSRDC